MESRVFWSLWTGVIECEEHSDASIKTYVGCAMRTILLRPENVRKTSVF